MAMTYYAVTDDPNELVHWGIKGMKWGVRRTDAQLGHPRHSGSRKPRSAAYKKAQSKLSKAMQNGIQKVETKWKVYNSPANKQIRAEKRYEKQTERALAKARKGKLKYGKLTDDQIYRITDRLAIERNARQLSETEKTWGKRLRESIGAGIISGVGQGAGRMASEAIARKSVLKTDRKRAEQQERMDKERQRRQFMQEMAFQEIRDKRAASARVLKREAQKQADQEYYNEAAKRGYNHPYLNAIASGNRPRIQTARERANQLQAWQEGKRAEDVERSREDTINKTFASTYAKRLADTTFESQYPNASKGEKKKEKKAKDKGPGAGQAPIVQNFYGYGSDNDYRFGTSGYGVRRLYGNQRSSSSSSQPRGPRPNPDWHGDLRPPTSWGGPQTTPIPDPYETPGRYARRRRRAGKR